MNKKQKNKNKINVQLKNAKLSYTGGDFFEVEAIRDKRVINNETKYLIKWKDWQEETNTWETYSNLKSVKQMVEAYEIEVLGNRDFVFPEEEAKSSELSFDEDPEGSLETDIPIRIHGVVREGDRYMVEVEWMCRTKTGFKPLNSQIDRDIIKKTKHLILLIEFYERIIRWLK